MLKHRQVAVQIKHPARLFLYGDPAVDLRHPGGKNRQLLWHSSLLPQSCPLCNKVFGSFRFQLTADDYGARSGVLMIVAAVLSVFMPVPIALDVMFAGQLYRQGVNPGYVMLFLTTLGTFSIIPAVYLWREVSRALAVYLFAFFVAAGIALGLLFAALA
jgi:hypothetical protein